MSAQTKESTLISIRVSNELNELIELACALKGSSKSDLVRDLVMDGLRRLADADEVQKLLEDRKRQLAEELAQAEEISAQMRDIMS